MKITERKISIREIVEDYFNDAEEGVVGYKENLDIRPPYQREFVYKGIINVMRLFEQLRKDYL